MPKRRRRLSKDYEKLIAKSEREVELYIAKIKDIDDDDIRIEYTVAFASVKSKLDYLKNAYTNIGYNEDSDTLLLLYQEGLRKFVSEYEI